jgi:hypothetical protein
MRVIRQAQLAIFKEQARIQFELKLVRHFLNVYPRESAEAGGQPQIAKLVSRGVRRANEIGYSGASQIWHFVALMFILGDDFDADPQLPWVSRQLHDARTPLDLRPALAFDAALEYLGATAGVNCEYLVRAMIRLRSYELESAPDTAGELWVDDCCDLLDHYYPEKFNYQGDAANRALISLARRHSEMLGFKSNRSAALITILMFMLGSGFAHDLLYPWAEAALLDESAEPERIKVLHLAALNHLDKSLVSDNR